MKDIKDMTMEEYMALSDEEIEERQRRERELELESMTPEERAYSEERERQGQQVEDDLDAILRSERPVVGGGASAFNDKAKAWLCAGPNGPTSFAMDAFVFANLEEARQFLEEHEILRPHHYIQVWAAPPLTEADQLAHIYVHELAAVPEFEGAISEDDVQWPRARAYELLVQQGLSATAAAETFELLCAAHRIARGLP